ncbi:MAG: linked oxidase protein [Conexibacter sp.]|nr:linked oxidase protein [Conexibacter sp.]
MTAATANAAGQTFWRGDDGYERARLDAVWHERKPDRHPAVIVVPATEQEVVDAVRMARERGLQIKACSGGHSFTCSSHREGGMLIDLGALTGTTVDAAAGTATAQPGASGRLLNDQLLEHDLFFPTGHCQSVALGGYLLQGGWGWYSRVVGPACGSVTAIDVVTADGELLHADEHHHADLLWAARGAGSGFFGVVTRFYLACHPRPRSMMVGRYLYPVSLTEDVLYWLHALTDQAPPGLEFMFHSRRRRTPDGVMIEGAPSPHVTGIAMFDSDAECEEALALLATCPVVDRASESRTNVPTTLNGLYDANAVVTLQRYAWVGDGLWTDAPAEQLVPAFQELCLDVASNASYAFWYPWSEPEYPDCALSITGKHYLAGFGAWTPPDDGRPYRDWLAGHLRRMEPLSKGIQLADENLLDRPESRYMSETALRRLDAIRATYDPDGRFYSYFYGEQDTPGPV